MACLPSVDTLVKQVRLNCKPLNIQPIDWSTLLAFHHQVRDEPLPNMTFPVKFTISCTTAHNIWPVPPDSLQARLVTEQI
jgi:hypothetical protein